MQKSVALITGASRGIGKSVAFRLAHNGYRVILNDHHREAETLDSVVTELKQGGADATAVVADVTVEGDVKAMIQGSEKLGGLDVMVANAGICIVKPLLKSSLQDYQRIFSVNSMGTFLCYRYAAQLMVEQGRGGRIVGAASLAAKQAWPLLSLYSSTKFAIRGLTQAAAKELAGYGITVNAYAPGTVDTSMVAMLEEQTSTYITSKIESEQALASMRPPSGRYTTADEVASLVSYLVSKEAAQITGQTFGINGGMHVD